MKRLAPTPASNNRLSNFREATVKDTYFPHDTAATQDPKMLLLISKVGLEGLGLYWILIEAMHRDSSGALTQEEFDCICKMNMCSTAGEHDLSSMFNTEVYFNVGLFERDDQGLITSRRVLQNKNYRHKLSSKRSLGGKVSAQVRRTTKESNMCSNRVEQTENGCSTEKVLIKEIKEINKIKEKKINKESAREYAPHVRMLESEYLNLCSEFGSETVDGFIRTCSDYQASTGKRYRDIPATFRNWQRRHAASPPQGQAPPNGVPLPKHIQAIIETGKQLGIEVDA